MKKIELLAFALGIIIGAGLVSVFTGNPFQTDDHTYYSDDVHVHADFAIYINDQKIDLTEEKFQSSAEQILHKNVHLHDGEDHVVHRHAEDITFVEFLSSLGFSIAENCLGTDSGESHCADGSNELILYVNEEEVSMYSYIPQEKDRVLLYFGTPDNQNINAYLDSVTNDSCIYSGTCPERGVAPPESCGLTCDL